MIAVFDWLEHHPGLASWLQAVGTVGALWFAFVQITGSRRSDRKRYRAILRGLETFIQTLRWRMEFCERSLMRDVAKGRAEVASIAKLVLPESGLDVAEAAFDAFPMQTLMTWQVIFALSEIRAYVSKAKTHLEDLANPASTTNPLAFGVALRGIERHHAILTLEREKAETSVWKKLRARVPFWLVSGPF